MLWTDRNGKMHSTTNLLPQTNTDEFIENCEAVAEKNWQPESFEEMFGTDPYNERGQDSAFMDDTFGRLIDAEFQVTQIEFDFTNDVDDPLTDEYKQSLTDETIEGGSR